MAKDDMTAEFADLMKQTQALMAWAPMLTPQMEQFWKAQDDILEEAEAFSKAWYERRHDAARSALKAVRKLNGSDMTPMNVMQSMAEWHRHSLERLSEDMQGMMGLCARCAGRIASAETIAAEKALKETAKQSKAATATSKATPV